MTLEFKPPLDITYQENLVINSGLKMPEVQPLLNALKDDFAIVIDITSPRHNVGKTSIAAYILACLRQNGFTNISVGCTDGDLDSKAQFIANGDLPNSKVKTHPIVILDVNRGIRPSSFAKVMATPDTPNSQ